jgi:hypothetical protein
MREDPFLELGFGISAYFDFIKQLIYATLLLTVLAIPALTIYSDYSNFESHPNYWLNKYSLGNMGGASTQCSLIPIGVPGGRVDMSCPSGTIDLYAIDSSTGQTLFDIGIINKSQ